MLGIGLSIDGQMNCQAPACQMNGQAPAQYKQVDFLGLGAVDEVFYLAGVLDRINSYSVDCYFTLLS